MAIAMADGHTGKGISCIHVLKVRLDDDEDEELEEGAGEIDGDRTGPGVMVGGRNEEC